MNYIALFFTGAMLVICDVNEYRRSIKDFKIPLILELFEKLHALCNLLVVVPENLKQVCSGEQLVNFISIIFVYFVLYFTTSYAYQLHVILLN